MSDNIYHMALKLLSTRILDVKMEGFAVFYEMLK